MTKKKKGAKASKKKDEKKKKKSSSKKGTVKGKPKKAAPEKKSKKKKAAPKKATPEKKVKKKSKKVLRDHETALIPITDIKLLKGFNPRSAANAKKGIDYLKQSISKNGLINPLTVWAQEGKTKTRYYLICGQRRLNAIKLLGWSDVSCTLRKDIESEEEALAMAIAENADDTRTQLSPLEEAEAYLRLVDAGWNQSNIARRVGCSLQKVRDSLKLLNAPKKAKSLLQQEKVKPDAVRAVMNIDDTETRNHVMSNMSKGTTAADVQRQKTEFVIDKSRRKGSKKPSKEELKKARADLNRGKVIRPRKDIENTLIRMVETYRDKVKKEAKELGWAIMTMFYILSLVDDISKTILKSEQFKVALQAYHDKIDTQQEEFEKAAEIEEDIEFDDDEDIEVEEDDEYEYEEEDEE